MIKENDCDSVWCKVKFTIPTISTSDNVILFLSVFTIRSKFDPEYMVWFSQTKRVHVLGP